MKKKNVILIVVGIFVILGVYFGYKGFNLLYYDINNITVDDYESFVKQFNIKDTITIKHKDIQDNDYFEYQNIKIRNDFKEFEELEQNNNTSTSSPKLVVKDENNNTSKAFWMGVTDNYVYLLKADKTLFGTEDNRITNTDLTNILEKNNIKDDIDLFNYLSKQKKVKNNIFTSVKKMKENYTINFMVSVIMPVMDSITLIDGDYNGYIFNLQNNMKEVSIIDNDKRYVFMFINTDYFTDDYLKELLSTVVID